MCVKTVTLVLAAVALGGCASIRHGHELDSTEEFYVTPANGVWDDEYGRCSDPDDCSFKFRIVRYADGIGVKASVFDNNVVTDDCAADAIAVCDESGKMVCPAWDDDNLECFFDGDNDRSKDSRSGHGLEYGGEFTFVANGGAQSDFSGFPKTFGKGWTGKVAKTRLPNGGYRLDYDMWFAWSCLGKRVAPAPGEDVTFGFNICIHDDDDGGRNDRALYWKGNPARPYRDESQFGTITLKGSEK